MDRQTIPVLLLLFAFFFGYQYWFVKPKWDKYYDDLAKWEERNLDAEADPESDPAPVGSGVAAVGSAEAPSEGADPPSDEGAQPLTRAEHPSDEAIAFHTETQDIVLSTAGGSLSGVTFNEILSSAYRPVQSADDDAAERGSLTLLQPYTESVRSLAMVPMDPDLGWVATADWAHEALDDGGHRFTLDLPKGLRLIKTYTRPAEASEGAPNYHFDLAVTVENRTQGTVSFGYQLNGPAGIVNQSFSRASYGEQAILAAYDPDEEEFLLETPATSSFEKLGEPESTMKGEVGYFGLGTHYFAAVVVPEGETSPVESLEAYGLLQLTEGRNPSDQEREDLDGVGRQGIVRGRIPAFSLDAGASRTDRYMVYVGPRQKAVFEAEGPYADHELEQLVDYGWFETFARALLSLLIVIHSVCGNWGFAVILLTFLVRGLLLPSSVWSQRNMLRMQKLAPEINKLKEKYARADGSMSREAQQQFSMAQMQLFRDHKVNPIGCLGPMFLQIPVFIGLYNALSYSFELRQTAFIGWITDLSVPDVLFRLPFTIPLLGTNAFSVLPIIMVIVYVVQNQMQPKATDPRQAEQQKMMKFVLPVIGLLLYTMPSGLMLYFVTSTLWGLAELKLVRKRIEEAEKAKPAR